MLNPATKNYITVSRDTVLDLIRRSIFLTLQDQRLFTSGYLIFKLVFLQFYIQL